MSAFLMDLILLCRSASESFQRPAALLNVQFLANGGVTPIRALGGTVGVGLPVATGRAGMPRRWPRCVVGPIDSGVTRGCRCPAGRRLDATIHNPGVRALGGPVPALRATSRDSDFPSTGRLCNEPRRSGPSTLASFGGAAGTRRYAVSSEFADIKGHFESGRLSGKVEPASCGACGSGSESAGGGGYS